MSKSQVADDLRRFGNVFAGMLEAADMLDKIGGMDNHVAELTGTVAGLQAEVKTLKSDRTKVTAAIKKRKGELSVLVNETDKSIKDMMAEAKAIEKKNLKSAKAKALKDVVKSTEREKKALEEAKKRNARISKEYTKLVADSMKVSSDVKDKKTELKGIKDKIAELKKSFGA